MLIARRKGNKKRLLKEPLSLRGAAYRIRTYDALIRSQVLYPAEVTPRAVIYNAVPSPICPTGISKCEGGVMANGNAADERLINKENPPWLAGAG